MLVTASSLRGNSDFGVEHYDFPENSCFALSTRGIYVLVLNDSKAAIRRSVLTIVVTKWLR